MISITTSLQRRDNLATTYELYADGHTRGDIRSAVQRGTLIRARQGWYAARGLHPLLLEAVRVGGRLTCLSALKLQGHWAPAHRALHVAVDPTACRLRSRSDPRRRLNPDAAPSTRVHWRVLGAGSRLMLDPLRSLEDALGCVSAELVAAIGDSILHSQSATPAEWAGFVASASSKHQRTLSLVDGVCESGTESLFWFRMHSCTARLRRQVQLPVGRVDFVLGERLVVEVDGAEYHTDPERFESDRRRDAVLSQLGYRVLRFSYRQVVERWPEVEAAAVTALVRGDHR